MKTIKIINFLIYLTVIISFIAMILNALDFKFMVRKVPTSISYHFSLFLLMITIVLVFWKWSVQIEEKDKIIEQLKKINIELFDRLKEMHKEINKNNE